MGDPNTQQPNARAGAQEGQARPLDPLVELLLPSVIHRLGNATQLLTGLNSMLALGDVEGRQLVASRGQDLERAGSRATEVGYALAVLGSAQGAELLLARREREGLRWLMGFLAEALRRQGLLLSPCELPDLAPGAGDGWRPPWAVARVVLASALHAGEGATVHWSLQAKADAWHLELASPLPATPPATVEASWERLRQDLARLAPQVRLAEGQGQACKFPLEWFQA